MQNEAASSKEAKGQFCRAQSPWQLELMGQQHGCSNWWKKALLTAVHHNGQRTPSFMMQLLGQFQEGVPSLYAKFMVDTQKTHSLWPHFLLGCGHFVSMRCQFWRRLENLKYFAQCQLVPWNRSSDACLKDETSPGSQILQNSKNFFKMGTWTPVLRYDLIMIHLLSGSFPAECFQKSKTH